MRHKKGKMKRFAEWVRQEQASVKVTHPTGLEMAVGNPDQDQKWAI